MGVKWSDLEWAHRVMGLAWRIRRWRQTGALSPGPLGRTIHQDVPTTDIRDGLGIWAKDTISLARLFDCSEKKTSVETSKDYSSIEIPLTCTVRQR